MISEEASSDVSMSVIVKGVVSMIKISVTDGVKESFIKLIEVR